MLVNHDIHVHTNLSACSHDPNATPEKYIARAAEIGLSTIGFANHLWDSALPGASKWYTPQDYNHIMQIREQLPSDTRRVKVLIGCESEYCGDGKVGISYETAGKLDFVLLPMSHTHMKGFVLPETISESTDIAKLMVRRFNEMIALRLATGVAHPFLPCGYTDRTDEIIAAITDAEFVDCFTHAAQAGTSIEIHIGFFDGSRGEKRKGFSDDTFLRVLTIAKKCGCCFHFASDAHSLSTLDRVMLLEPYAKELGLAKSNILPCLR